MRKFLAISLALVLGFFGSILLSHAPKGLTAPSNAIADLTFLASTDGDAVEQEPLGTETIVPKRVLLIPKNQPGANTPVQFGVRITNNMRFPTYFPRYHSFFPEIVRPDGEVLYLTAPVGGGSSISNNSKGSHCPLVKPKESWTVMWNWRLNWKNNKLVLQGNDDLGNWWTSEEFKPGIYQVRFWYDVPLTALILCESHMKISRTVENIWRDKRIITRFVKFSLVQE